MKWCQADMVVWMGGMQSLLLLTIYPVKPVVLERLVENRLATPVISTVMEMKRVYIYISYLLHVCKYVLD